MKMSGRPLFKLPQNFLRFTKTARNGKTVTFRWETLSSQRLPEFMDVKINYYAKDEITHIVAGIHNRRESIEEYKQILENDLKHPMCLPLICCVDDEKAQISAIDCMKLYRKGDSYKDPVPATTPEVKKYFEIVNKWNGLYPVQDVVTKYNVESFFDDTGFVVHPDFRGFGLSKEAALIRGHIGKENNVPMTGAWHTSVATQRGSDNAGWETAFEISYQELEKILNIKFDNPPPTFQYKVKRIG